MQAMSRVVFQHDLLNLSKLAMTGKVNTTGNVMSTALFLFDLDLVMLTHNPHVTKEQGKGDGDIDVDGWNHNETLNAVMK
jgi:hypothetical protein